MLESLHVRPAICKQIRSGPLGTWVEPFIAALAQRGHAPSVRRRHLRAAAVFGAWMRRHHLSVTTIDEAVVARFSREQRRWQSTSRPGGRINGLVTGVGARAAAVWGEGVAGRPAHMTPATERDRGVPSFD